MNRKLGLTEYYSFDLRISEWNAASHTGYVEVLHSPAGEGDPCTFSLEIDPAWQNERPLRSEPIAKQIGKRLYQCLFQGANGALWRESYQIAREREHVLRLRLHIDAIDLAMLPWESLCDERGDDFLVFDPHVSLVRYLRLHAVPPHLKDNTAIRVLVVIAMPKDRTPLDWRRELRSLREALQEMITSEQVELVVSERTTHDKLHLALLQNAPDVVHFIGHGAYDRIQGKGILALENENGGLEPLAAGDAARLLRRYGVSLVVLNACETAKGAWAGLAPSLIRAEVPAVVAMQWSVEDRAAIRFTRAFYTALALGQPIDQCVSEGRVGASASSSDPNDWAAPVLFSRSATGRLWKSEPSVPPGQDARLSPVSPPVLRSGADTLVQPTRTPGRDEVRFETRGPLRAPKDNAVLIDRPELAAALRLAQQASMSQYIALLSPRDTGKTTLLLRLWDHLKAQYPCVFVDLSVLTAQDARTCFRLLAFKLVSAIWSADVDPSSLPSVADMKSAVEFVAFLKELATMVSFPRITLILDEVGALAPAASEAFFNALRTVFMQGRGFDDPLAKYLFIFSGSVDLYSLTSGTTSPLNICEKIYLADLKMSDISKLLRLFTKWGVMVTSEAAGLVHGWTAGHPYLTMRFCALLRSSGAKVINRDAIDRVAEQMLINDDNIDHVVRALERRPPERRRLQSILLEGRKLPFTRNDPVLASLEMIGAIRPTQPIQIRNLLYERALRTVYTETPVARVPIRSDQERESEMIYVRLQALHDAARETDGRYCPGRAWETFAAELFSLVPVFSVAPNLYSDSEQLDILLLVDAASPDSGFWASCGPGIMVTCDDLYPHLSRADLIKETVRKSKPYGTKLVLVMTSTEVTGDESQVIQEGDREICIALIGSPEIDRLLEKHHDLEAFLRNRVLQARLHNCAIP